MTNRQSNIIFYSVISIIIFVVVGNNFYPDFLENFSKSKTELSIDEAMAKGEHDTALMLYQKLLEDNTSGGEVGSAITADMYEEMASLHLLLGNKVEEKNHYLKALDLRKQSKKNNISKIIIIYNKLGSIAQDEKQYDQAQLYYEKSLSMMLGNSQEIEEGDEGFFEGMQNAQQRYLRQNHEWTIAALTKLGAVHQLKKEYSIAKKYYEKALAASKLTFGEDDAKTLELMEIMKRYDL